MTLTQIGNCIDENKPFEFINVYLTCLGQGFLLRCPTESDPKELNQIWANILSKFRQNFSDEFCHIVATEWGRLVSKCDPTSPDFEQQLLQQGGIAVEPYERPDRLVKKTVQGDLSSLQAHDGDPLTKPAISATYRERQLAEGVALPEKKELAKNYEQAFRRRNSDEFLTAHLMFSQYDDPKNVPMVSLPQQIRANWEQIIADEFGTIAPDEFLLSITNEWFYLVNQKGIPLTPEDHYELLMTFLAKKNQIKSENLPPKKASLLKKFLGL